MFSNGLEEMDLSEKLKKIEALLAATIHDGERQAAKLAHERIISRQRQKQPVEALKEYKICLQDAWRKGLVA